MKITPITTIEAVKTVTSTVTEVSRTMHCSNTV
jgi:hypothetical protein